MCNFLEWLSNLLEDNYINSINELMEDEELYDYFYNKDDEDDE
jgi:hypothetical protein